MLLKYNIYLFKNAILILSIISVLPIIDSKSNNLEAGQAACHLLVCCRSCDQGTTFLLNGEWVQPNYNDINHVRDILQKIKDAGINIVIIDMTNRPQWLEAFEKFYREKIDNIEQVCREKDMTFFIQIGHSWSAGAMQGVGLPSDASYMEAWGVIAQKVWNLWAQKPTYQKYGYGDDRPILGVFRAGDGFWKEYATLRNKRGYPRFKIATMQYNTISLIAESDGWGYRNSIGNPSGTVRYTSPLRGIVPGAKVSPEEFGKRIEWAKQAKHYSIYGSYDDTCDEVQWGISDTSQSTKSADRLYPDHYPWAFYDVLKEKLTGGEHKFEKTIQVSDFNFSSHSPKRSSYNVNLTSGNTVANVTFTLESIGDGDLRKMNSSMVAITSGNPDYMDRQDALRINYQINWVESSDRIYVKSEGFTGFSGESLGQVSINNRLVSTGFHSYSFASGSIFKSGDQSGGNDPRIRIKEFTFELVVDRVDLSFSRYIPVKDFPILNGKSSRINRTYNITSNGKTANVTFYLESVGSQRSTLRSEPIGDGTRGISISSGNPNFIDGNEQLRIRYRVNRIYGANNMSIVSEGFSGFTGNSLEGVGVNGALINSDYQLYPFGNRTIFNTGQSSGGNDPRIRLSGFYFELDLARN